MIPSAETKFHSAANFWEMLGVCQKRLHMFCRPRESIRPDSSWKALGVLREYGVDGRLLLAVKSLYSCSEDCVPLDGVKSQPFGVGLRQWCVLSPLLFIVYIRVLHTTARRSNSTYEAISSGRKTHFANNEKVIYLQKMCWLGRMEHIPKKLVYMNWIDSHRRIDEGVTVGNCRMNRWRFAGELVLHAWIFSTRIWSFFCCVRPKRNENQL